MEGKKDSHELLTAIRIWEVLYPASFNNTAFQGALSSQYQAEAITTVDADRRVLPL
jgi:hypothetical protein